MASVLVVSDDALPNEKRMRLRYDGACRVCGAALAAKVEAIYERSSKTVRCTSHDDAARVEPIPEPVIETGVAGASARREFERRKAKREQRIREKHPKIGGLLHALSTEPQSTTAWDLGALGEERVGNLLDDLAGDRIRVLHDRRIPGTRANIDHLAVTPTGVYVIDPKKYVGRPHLKAEGGLLRPRVEKLMVGSRDHTSLVDGVLKQIAIVNGVLSEAVPVRGVLCFVDADWPVFGGTFTTRGVDVMWPRQLQPTLTAEGPVDVETIMDTHALLASALPPA